MYRSLKDTAPASFLYRASSEIEIPRVSFKNVNFVTPIHQDYLNKISKDNYSGFVWAGSISLLYIAHHHAWILLYPLSTCFPFTGTRREEREECQPCKSCEESRLEEGTFCTLDCTRKRVFGTTCDKDTTLAPGAGVLT